MSEITRRQVWGILMLFIGAGALCVLSMMIDHAPDGTISLAWPASNFAGFRFTAIGVGVIVGASLGISGMLLQALLRNPLASPFILGVSNGAGLGVMIALYVTE